MCGKTLFGRLLTPFSVEVSEANWEIVRSERYESSLEVPCRVRISNATLSPVISRYLAIMTLIQNLDHIRKNYNVSRQLDTLTRDF